MFKNKRNINMRKHGFREWLGSHDIDDITDPIELEREQLFEQVGQFEEPPGTSIAQDKSFVNAFGDMHGSLFKDYLRTIARLREKTRLQRQDADRHNPSR